MYDGPVMDLMVHEQYGPTGVPLRLCDRFCNGWDALWDGLGRGWMLS